MHWSSLHGDSERQEKKCLDKLWNPLLTYLPMVICCNSLHRGMRHIDEEQSKATTHLGVLVDTISWLEDCQKTSKEKP